LKKSDELISSSKSYSLEVLSSETKKRIYDSVSAVLNEPIIQKKCAVYDCFVENPNRYELQDLEDSTILHRMRKHLVFPDNLPDLLYSQYDQSAFHTCLKNIMLEKNGIQTSKEPMTIEICQSCCRTLYINKMPKNAIANGLYYGYAPPFISDLNRTELAMLNWAIPNVYLTSIAGGRNMALRSYSYQLINSNGPIASQLPNDILSQGVMSVSIIGNMTNSQRTILGKRYEARSNHLLKSLKWFKQSGNHLYESIDIRAIESHISRDSERVNTKIFREEGQFDETELDEAMNRFNLRDDNLKAAASSDEQFMTSNPSVIVNTTPSTFVQIERSNNYISDFDATYWIHCFAELFPFGRGAYNEPRKENMSLHYL
jgi:hypothetical protein